MHASLCCMNSDFFFFFPVCQTCFSILKLCFSRLKKKISKISALIDISCQLWNKLYYTSKVQYQDSKKNNLPRKIWILKLGDLEG